MGIISTPLFATPADARIIIAHIPRDLLEMIDSYTCDPELFKAETITLSDFMRGLGEHLKLYGYLTREVIIAWRSFMSIISADNGGCCVELHFFCMDERMPYYLQYVSGGAFLCTYDAQLTLEEFCIQVNSKTDIPLTESSSVSGIMAQPTKKVANTIIELTDAEKKEAEETNSYTSIISRHLKDSPGYIYSYGDEEETHFIEREYKKKREDVYKNRMRFENLAGMWYSGDYSSILSQMYRVM